MVTAAWHRLPVGGGDGRLAPDAEILLFNLFIALKDVVDLLGSEPQPLASQPGDVSFRSALIRFCYLTKQINNLIVSDPGLIYFGRIGRWNKDGEFAMRLLEMRRYFSGCALTELLVKLGQLPSDNYWSVNQFSKFPKCLLQLVWRLEEHRQPVPGTSSGLLEPPFTVFSPNWWEAKKGEAMGSDAGRRNRRDHSACAGDWLDRKTLVADGLHERGAGVRDSRGAGVRHQRDRFALREPTGNPIDTRPLVVLVNAEDLRINIEMTKQDARPARIFGSDELDLLENLERAKGDVVEVADRGGDQVERPQVSRRLTSVSPIARIAEIAVDRARGQLGDDG